MTRKPFENFEELARRALACKRWRSMPGMLVIVKKITIDDGDRAFRLDDSFDIRQWPYGYPDLTDPATLGCLLALVREAHNAPHAWVETRYGKRARVLDPQGMSEGARMLCGWTIGTEAAALVAALEAAP